MSKEHHISQVEKKVKQPEVGDLWEIQGRRFYIVDVTESLITVLNELYCLCGLLLVEVNTFTKKAKYLGKSKVSIKELFEVEKENNEKDKLADDLKQMVRDSAKQVREIIDNWNKGV